MKIKTLPSNGARQVRYVDVPSAPAGYLLSAWTDGKLRLTNERTGNIARTFAGLSEAAQYFALLRP